MADLTHPAFRTLVDEYGGCDLYFSEMISAEAFLGGTPFEYAYRDARPDPQRLVYQLVGRSAEAILEAARRLAAEPVYGIDVNMGCSAPQIAKRGAGVSWMRYPLASARLIERIRAVAPGKTVSAKFRLGIGEDPRELADFARALEAAGASFLTLHPRFLKQSYSRPAHWSYVARLREALSIPLYGSGDITDAASLRARVKESGVEGAMIGRAAAQKPWIFAGIRAALAAAGGAAGDANITGAPTTAVSGPGVQDATVDLAAVAGRFHEFLEAMLPEAFFITRSRRFYAYFLKNLAFGHRLAAQVQQLESYEEIKAHVASYFAEHLEHRTLSLGPRRSAGGVGPAGPRRPLGKSRSEPRRHEEQLHA
jgi:tRNA-dihydrouridine synthase